MDASLTNLNKLTIARQVRAFRARPANTGVRHKQVVEAFEAAWSCSGDLTAEQIAHASAFVEEVLAEDDARIERGKKEILADIAGGTVPGDEPEDGQRIRSFPVERFAHLHDYVDANYYGGLFETDVHGLHGDELIDVGIIVQNALDAWMREGGHRAKGGA